MAKKNSQPRPPTVPPLASQEMYKKGTEKVLLIKVFLGFLLIFLLISWWTQHNTPPPKYDLVTKNQLIPLETNNTPVLSISKVQNWSGRAVSDIFSFKFNNADEHMLSMRPYFNSGAWSTFISSINSTKLVQTVKKDSLIVEVTPLKSPYVVMSPYMNMGKRVWPDVEVPVLISYIGALNSKTIPTQKITFVLTIVEVDSTDNPDGLQIASMNPTDYSP